jgi:hypothetical protein
LRMSTMKGKASPPAASTTGQGRGRFNINRLLGQVHFLTRFTFCACSRSYGSIKNSALFKAVSLNDVFKYKYSLNIWICWYYIIGGNIIFTSLVFNIFFSKLIFFNLHDIIDNNSQGLNFSKPHTYQWNLDDWMLKMN